MFKRRKILMASVILLLFIGAVSASENITDNAVEFNLENEVSTDSLENISDECIANQYPADVNIKTADVVSYYGDKADVVTYLKDNNGYAIQNKTLKVEIANNTYDTFTDGYGKASLTVTNLKPGNYKVNVCFGGDEQYNASSTISSVKIKKTPLAIKMSNYNTYVDSDLFFKVKVYNTETKKAVSGIRVKFIVYNTKTKKYSNYWSITDKDGVAKLKKNFKVGEYKISAKIDDSKNKKYLSYKNSKSKVTMKVKPTAEWGCCSFYLQVSGTESVAGFRRDATNALDIYIKNVKFAGRTAIKQYKLGYGYFFHSITTSDGWMMGTGGMDNVAINKAIEKLAGKMVKSNKIKTSYLKKIQSYERRLGLGHFSIKAPDGRYAVVWLGGYWSGKLKAGEYVSVPNFMSCYRHGNYEKFDKNPVKAAIKVGATDSFGVNRRDITVFHWKATTDKNYKTTSSLKTYAANDNGKLVGRSTGYLKDNIRYKNSFISKYKLPSSPNKKFLGTHKFGNIDKLIKTPTKVSAPNITAKFNQTKNFKITIKNKKTGKVLSDVKFKFKVSNGNVTKTVVLKTDKNGVAKFDTKNLLAGTYKVAISTANNKYLISAKSKILISQ